MDYLQHKIATSLDRRDHLQMLFTHFQTPLPYCTVLFAFVWSYVHHNWAETAIRCILPENAYAKLAKKRLADPNLDKMCKVNAVAFLHASLTVPLAFLCFIPNGPLRDDKISGFSGLALCLCWVMCGYFLWDTQICLKHLKLYGVAFLLHGILSLIGLYGQAAMVHTRLLWYLTVFMGSEVSTPFLHIRWFLTKADATRSWYFQITNFIFLALFVGYRLIFLEIYAFYPYIRENGLSRQGPLLTPYQWRFSLAFIIAWSALNYHWGFLLCKSQWRHWKPKFKTP